MRLACPENVPTSPIPNRDGLKVGRHIEVQF